MSLKEILLHLDNTPNCPARLELAVQLANRHSARLTALYILTSIPYASRSMSADKQAVSAEAMFRQRCDAAGIKTNLKRVDCRVVGVSAGEIITMHSYYSDLVIVGQTLSATQGSGGFDKIPERVILGSGRPVLTVPYAGGFKTAGERVMVAWKAGRESARALNDALPLLEAAREVTLVTVDGIRRELPATGSIAEYLESHGVAVRCENIKASGLSIADLLLNRVSEQGIDLLVTGAFGYTSKGAPELGAVAGQLLASMTIPVLMSH